MVKVGMGIQGSGKNVLPATGGLCRGRRKAEIYEYPCAVSKGYEGMQ